MKVMLGMSGGVDSAVAAILLKDKGYDVIGVFMDNWEEKDENGICTATLDYNDARKACEHIGIPFYSVSFKKEYYERVFTYFLDEYQKGRTPNPDILCNSYIKFRSFLDLKRSSDVEYFATGHYARLKDNKLYRAKDKNKDQTYFLAGLSENQLSDVLFPIGEYEKREIREIANKHGLSIAKKKDSTGICFIGERNFKKFLMQYLPAQKGKIVDDKGKELGEHDGLMYYTIGQRKGLNIGGVKGEENGCYFVIKKDLQNNILIVGKENNPLLYSSGLYVGKLNFINGAPPQRSFECTAKFRYRQADVAVKVDLEGDGARVGFFEKQRAITPGQWAVFYDDDICLGGGAIDYAMN